MSEGRVRKRFCVNCGHNIREATHYGIECRCEIDNHRIGYVDCIVQPEFYCADSKRKGE